jgi:hypothetical protein
MELFLLIGVIFGVLAACAAFLITYNEYYKHGFRGAPLYKESLRPGIFTFVFFVCLSLLIGYLLTNFVIKG